MRAFNKVMFVTKESTKGLIKNFSKTFLQFLICFISLVFFSVVFGIYYNVQDLAKDMRNKIEISIFLKDDATKSEITNIENTIKSYANVKSYSFISKEEARKNGEDIFKDMPEMLETIGELENPFPSSFKLELENAEFTEDIAKSFYSMPGVEKDGIKYGEEYVDKILSLSNGLVLASYVALIFFFVIAVFFMISIVNIIISQNEEEINIKFMIGASPSQITMPFYVQGLFIGLLSSALAFFAFLSLYDVLTKNLSFILSDLSNVYGVLLAGILLTGVVSGLLATKLALLKFNRTKRKISKKIKG